MPLMELKLSAQYAGQQILNVFNYLATGTPAAVSFSFGLVSAFGAIDEAGLYPPDTVLDALRAIQTNGLLYLNIEVRDVYSNTDFYSTPFIENTTGEGIGEGLSPAMAVSFMSNRTRSDIRRGRKSFSGVEEGAVGEAGVLTAGTMSALALLGGRLGEILTYDDEGNTLSYAPVVVSKEEYTPDPLRPERKAYKYYDTFAEQDDHIMSSVTWQARNTIRTQVSRQYGRGR